MKDFQGKANVIIFGAVIVAGAVCIALGRLEAGGILLAFGAGHGLKSPFTKADEKAGE